MIMYLKLTDWRSIGCQKPRKLIETCRSCFILCQAKMNQNIWIYCGQIYLILQCQTSEVHGFSKKSHKYIFHQIDNFCNYILFCQVDFHEKNHAVFAANLWKCTSKFSRKISMIYSLQAKRLYKSHFLHEYFCAVLA